MMVNSPGWVFFFFFNIFTYSYKFLDNNNDNNHCHCHCCNHHHHHHHPFNMSKCNHHHHFSTQWRRPLLHIQPPPPPPSQHPMLTTGAWDADVSSPKYLFFCFFTNNYLHIDCMAWATLTCPTTNMAAATPATVGRAQTMEPLFGPLLYVLFFFFSLLPY